MSTPIFANFVNTSLAAPIGPSDTTILLASSAGLPTVSAGQIFPIILNDAATKSIYEIVYATAITGASCTVTRAQEGTTALSWGIGDYAYSTNTAQTTNALLVASTSQAQAWTDDTTAISPLKLSQAFKGTNQSLATNGYQKIPGGLILQWGTSSSITVNTNATITLPVAFPTAGLCASSTMINSDSSLTKDNAANVVSISTTQLVLRANEVNGNQTAAPYFWMAIGY